MNITVDVEIDSSITSVWTAITDIENCMDMLSGITALKILDKPEDGLIGLKWTETRKIFGKEAAETMWITDCKLNEYYCTRAENCGAIYSTKILLSEVDNKTLLTMNFSGSSESIFVRMISAIMSLFIKRTMVKMLEKDLSEIKAFVEKL